MSSVLDYYQTELFKVNRNELEKAIQNLKIYQYDLHFGEGIKDLIPKETSRYWHVAELLRNMDIEATIRESEGKRNIVTLDKLEIDPLFAYHIDANKLKIVLSEPSPVTLAPDNDRDFMVFRRFLQINLQRRLKDPLVVERWRVYDKSKEITVSPRGETSQLSNYVQVFQSVAFQLRKFGNEYFLAILPQSRISYEKSIDWLVRNGLVKDSEVSEKFLYVKLPLGISVRLVGLLNKIASDRIEEDAILAGRSFKEFAKVMYPTLDLKKDDSRLAVIGVETGPTIFSSEAIFPSPNFLSIRYLDETYYSSLISKLKLNSARRLDEAVSWAQELTPLTADGTSLINVEVVPHQKFALREPITYDKLTEELEVPGGIFTSPPVSFLRKTDKGLEEYEEFDVYPGYLKKYQGTINDLLANPELKPLDVPEEIKIVAYVEETLRNDWEGLLRVLKEGIGEKGYRGWSETFGAKLTCQTHSVSNFFAREFEEEVEKLKEGQYHCAIIVIPRILKTAEKTKQVYTETKTKIMRRGIPVQVITNDERQTEVRDRTLRGKSQDSRVLFGIAINIIAKAGCILSALSRDFAKSMIPNSLIIGYNVARVFPPVRKPSELLARKRKSIPLAAPLVIFDNRGAHIHHQDVFRLAKETSLFLQYGKDVMANIPKEIETILVHKDGRFYTEELASLRQLSKTDRKIIPISIIRYAVPRIFNRGYTGQGFQLKSGTFLPLSDHDFIMATTPTTRWEPKMLGWPSPIIIKIHEEDIGEELRSSMKLKILYQIYALTKMHAGSQRPTRVPISIHYSNMIARFLRKVGDPSPDYLPYFVRPTAARRYVPRWYI